MGKYCFCLNYFVTGSTKARHTQVRGQVAGTSRRDISLSAYTLEN